MIYTNEEMKKICPVGSIVRIFKDGSRIRGTIGELRRVVKHEKSDPSYLYTRHIDGTAIDGSIHTDVVVLSEEFTNEDNSIRHEYPRVEIVSKPDD